MELHSDSIFSALKELIQLLIKEITVYPFDPDKDKLPEGSLGVFKTRIRTKWFKIKMQLYVIPEISTDFSNLPKSSYSEKLGSPGRTRTSNPSVNSRMLHH